jgi:hypothetical protein
MSASAGAKVAIFLLMATPGCSQVGPSAVFAASAPDAGTAAAVAPALSTFQAEPREANPRSEKVKLKLWASPVTAEVIWGAKRLGSAGKEPLEIERPRASGPLDLVVQAPGYLPYHTRLYTDRDDAVTVRLVTPAAAPSLLGWKRSAPAPTRP